MEPAQIVVIIGSESDLPTLETAGVFKIFDEIGVSWTLSVISAHRNRLALEEYLRERYQRSSRTKVILAAAGKAAVLPGDIKVIANDMSWDVPVIGLALPSEPFGIHDALMAILSMPPGMVVHTFVDPRNAALAACEIVSQTDEKIVSAYLCWILNHTKREKIDIRGNATAALVPTV